MAIVSVGNKGFQQNFTYHQERGPTLHHQSSTARPKGPTTHRRYVSRNSQRITIAARPNLDQRTHDGQRYVPWKVGPCMALYQGDVRDAICIQQCHGHCAHQNWARTRPNHGETTTLDTTTGTTSGATGSPSLEQYNNNYYYRSNSTHSGDGSGTGTTNSGVGSRTGRRRSRRAIPCHDCTRGFNGPGVQLGTKKKRFQYRFFQCGVGTATHCAQPSTRSFLQGIVESNGIHNQRL
mmetsp:Transcript_12879/g.29077  ORF Transcript_12879/g.29077 Transcript_12879/m.29077 type:complete len:236 (+) Transcript_12879:392-1099(+)